MVSFFILDVVASAKILQRIYALFNFVMSLSWYQGLSGYMFTRNVTQRMGHRYEEAEDDEFSEIVFRYAITRLLHKGLIFFKK